MNVDLNHWASRVEALVTGVDGRLDAEPESDRQYMLEALTARLDELAGQMRDAARPCCDICDNYSPDGTAP